MKAMMQAKKVKSTPNKNQLQRRLKINISSNCPKTFCSLFGKFYTCPEMDK